MKLFKKILITAALFLSIASADSPLVVLSKGDHTLRLVGTIHIAKPDFYPLPEAVTSSLAKSDALAVELDMTDPRVMMKIAPLMQGFMAKDGKSTLDASRLKRLQNQVGKTMAARLKYFKPVIIAVAMEMTLAEKYGYSEKGIDETLVQQAKKDKKTILSIETPEEQMQIFAEVSDAEGLRYFDNTLERNPEEDLKTMEKIWRDGDHEAANQLIADMRQVAPDLATKMLDERNQIIANRLNELNKKHPNLFVAIGGLHVYGKGNVAERLEQLGYQRQ